MPGSRGGLPGLAGLTTRPAGYPSGGVPPAVERQLHLLTAHHPAMKKLRIVLPLTVGIRDGVVQLVSILRGVVSRSMGSFASLCRRCLCRPR
jgi:hypothetical protein